MNELIAQLDNVNINRLETASFKAAVRLHIYFTGRTHQLMLDFGTKAQGAILRAGGKDQALNGSSGYAAQSDLLRMWGDMFSEWSAEFQQMRREAAKIAFGVLAVRHERLVVSPIVASQIGEGIDSRSALAMTESKTADGVFEPQLRILLDIAANYFYGSSPRFELSDSIWQVDREARNGMNQIIMSGIQNGESAWNIAKQLQAFLGAGAECPRWTSHRLYGLTKENIASGDTTGLISGDACAGQGVSYNALRLARTEIQKMHSLATDRMMKQQPWVQSEKVNLSAAHPLEDECDDAVNGGANGDGVYPVGTIDLPLHPNCLCYKTAVMMPRDQFTGELNSWLHGGSSPMMDQYASDLGVDLSTSLMSASVNLAVWMSGNEETINKLLNW